MPRKKKKEGSSSKDRTVFHEDLKGFDLKINPFGEMESNFSIDKLNDFLDHRVEDKKLGNSTEEE